MISDDNFFFEVKKDYAKDMVTGFIRLNGNTIGAIANRTALYDEEGKEAETFDGTLSAEGAEKAAEFVNFCDCILHPSFNTDKCYRIQGNKVPGEENRKRQLQS